jgi:hypothetical protein
MVSSEVQRTLVKSPPELWAELSDPAALARHLGELGEIRITRIEPEQLVEWEADRTTGTVQIEPSGWGTRVTLTVATEVDDTNAEASPDLRAARALLTAANEQTPAASEPLVSADQPAAQAAALPGVHAEDEPAGYFESVPSPLGAPVTAAAASSWRAESQAEPAEAVPASSVGDEAEPAPEPTANAEADEAYEWQPYEEPEPRRGFFARFFGRLRGPTAFGEIAETASERTSPTDDQPEPPAGGGAVFEAPAESPSPAGPPADEIDPVDEAPDEELGAEGAAQDIAAEPEVVSPQPDPGEQGGGIAGDLKAAEEIAEAGVTAVLTSVLDRLGAAHHRPFSRS